MAASRTLPIPGYLSLFSPARLGDTTARQIHHVSPPSNVGLIDQGQKQETIVEGRHTDGPQVTNTADEEDLGNGSSRRDDMSERRKNDGDGMSEKEPADHNPKAGIEGHGSEEYTDGADDDVTRPGDEIGLQQASDDEGYDGEENYQILDAQDEEDMPLPRSPESLSKQSPQDVQLAAPPPRGLNDVRGKAIRQSSAFGMSSSSASHRRSLSPTPSRFEGHKLIETSPSPQSNDDASIVLSSSPPPNQIGFDVVTPCPKRRQVRFNSTVEPFVPEHLAPTLENVRIMASLQPLRCCPCAIRLSYGLPLERESDDGHSFISCNELGTERFKPTNRRAFEYVDWKKRMLCPTEYEHLFCEQCFLPKTVCPKFSYKSLRKCGGMVPSCKANGTLEGVMWSICFQREEFRDYFYPANSKNLDELRARLFRIDWYQNTPVTDLMKVMFNVFNKEYDTE